MTEKDWITNRTISSTQVTAVVYCSVVGFGLIVGPGMVIKRAGTAAPVIQLAILIFVLGVVQAIIGLIGRHPDLDLAGLLRTLLGPVGWPLGLFISVYWIALVGILVRRFADLIQSYFIPATPLWAMLLPLFLVAVYLVNRGLETMVRFFEVILLIELLSLAPIPFFASSGVKFAYLQPVLPHDQVTVENILFAGVSFIGYASLLVVAPAIAYHKRAGRAAGLGMALAGITILTFTIFTLGTFGADGVRQLLYPTVELLQAARVPRILSFLVRLAVVFLVIWTLAVVKTLSIALFVLRQNFAALFKIHERSRVWITLSLAGIMYGVAQWPESTLMTQNLVQWLAIIEVAMVPCLTALLWAASLIRRPNVSTRIDTGKGTDG